MTITSTPSATSAKPVSASSADAPARAAKTALATNQARVTPLTAVIAADLPLAEVVAVLQQQQLQEAEQRRQEQAAALQARQRFD